MLVRDLAAVIGPCDGFPHVPDALFGIVNKYHVGGHVASSSFLPPSLESGKTLTNHHDASRQPFMQLLFYHQPRPDRTRAMWLYTEGEMGRKVPFWRLVPTS